MDPEPSEYGLVYGCTKLRNHHSHGDTKGCKLCIFSDTDIIHSPSAFTFASLPAPYAGKRRRSENFTLPPRIVNEFVTVKARRGAKADELAVFSQQYTQQCSRAGCTSESTLVICEDNLCR